MNCENQIGMGTKRNLFVQGISMLWFDYRIKLTVSKDAINLWYIDHIPCQI